MKRKWTTFGIGFVLLLGVGLPAAAQLRDGDCLALSGDAFWACHWQKKADYSWESAVQTCRSQARNSVVIDGRTVIYGMSFDAFVSGSGRVKMVGPAHARFEFEKCMHKAGQPLQ
jgi:hypothetical protein